MGNPFSKEQKHISARNEDQFCDDSPYYLPPHTGHKDYASEFRDRHKSYLQFYNPDKCLNCLIGINLAVFGAWQMRRFVPKIEPMLWRHFTVSAEHIRQKYFHTALTCNFSHMDFWHVGINMVVVWGFSASLIKTFGWPHFLSLYLGAGLCSASASVIRNYLRGQPGLRSVGASGCIYGVIAAFVLMKPDAPLNFIFLPWLKFPAKYGIASLVAMDVFGIFRGWTLFDHSAHLGGFCFGAGYWFYLLSQKEANEEKGMKLIEDEAIYVGPMENYIAVGPAVIQSPSWTYYGELEDETLSGKACLRSESRGWSWTGKFVDGEMDGGGYLHQVNTRQPMRVIFKNNEFIPWEKHLQEVAERKKNESNEQKETIE